MYMIVRDFMKIAVIGSRGLIVRDLEFYLPEETTEIVSGGARGVDTSARYYAHKNGLKLTEFLPDYNKYGKIAPLMRNLEIIDYADEIYAFWDGTSRGTKYVIENCRRKKKKVHVFMLKKLDENDF
jgi:hypothetical protein